MSDASFRSVVWPGAAASQLALTPQAAQDCLLAVRPEQYARTRNHIDGAVTGLSPFITHGLLTLPQVLSQLLRVHGLSAQHKLVFELGWRAYFRHVWAHEGEGIGRSMHAGPLPDAAYAPSLPSDVAQGCTGLAVVDEAVRQLRCTGTLHNHARMWLASYVVHLRKVHWRAGADWMYAHLLDGDLASNHLSWQWVAGTGSHKPYLFNAGNVRRWASAAWHVDSSVLDVDYTTLEAWARDARRVLPAAAAGAPGQVPPDDRAPVAEPPAQLGFGPPQPAAVAGRDVWLVHPWSLAELPPEAAGALPVAVLERGFFQRWPWSPLRWQVVGQRMAQLATQRWWGDAPALLQALSGARSVRGWADPHLDAGAEPAFCSRLALQAPAPAFTDVQRRCRSFSDWWSRVKLHPDVAQAAADATPAAQHSLF